MTKQRLRNVISKTITLRLALGEYDHLAAEATRRELKPATLAAQLLVNALESLGGTPRQPLEPALAPSPQSEHHLSAPDPVEAIRDGWDLPTLAAAVRELVLSLPGDDPRGPLLIQLAAAAGSATTTVELAVISREIRAIVKDVHATRPAEPDYDPVFDGFAGPAVVPADASGFTAPAPSAPAPSAPAPSAPAPSAPAPSAPPPADPLPADPLPADPPPAPSRGLYLLPAWEQST